MTDLFQSSKVGPTREDRPYQLEGFNNLRTSIAQGVRRIVVEAPTGSGKTWFASKIANGARAKGNHMAFVVPAISLIDQTVEEFYDAGVRDIGVIQADHHLQDWTKPIQICSIQTIERRGVFPQCSVAIFDECHELYAAHKRWMADPAYANVPIIGLSATPWSKGLGNYFETKLVMATISELIEQRYLSKFKVYASSHPDLKKVKTVAGDYHEGQLSETMQEGDLVADIVKTYKEKWGKGRTLCFAVDKAHAQSLQARFNHAGVKCGYQDADTAMDVRRMIRNMFHDGTYEVVVSVDTLTRGVDWDVRCISLCRPTKSEKKFVQIIGRGLRLAPRGADPKEELIILDHSNTTNELGFVTDIYHEHLDCAKTPIKGGTSVKREKLPMECEACTALYPPNRERKCPGCGHVRVIQSGIIEGDGELFEVKRDGSMAQAAKVKAKEWTEAERRTFYAELKCYVEWHGHKPGFVAAKFKQKFGEWPPRAWEGMRAADTVSPTMAAWIKSRNIAWVKSKRRFSNATAS